MSDKLYWQYDRGKTYDKNDIGTSKLLADSKYRGWHYTVVINIGGNPFNYFTWHKAGLAFNTMADEGPVCIFRSPKFLLKFV